MGSLIYLMSTSVDGYTTGADGRFDWAEPTPVVHEHAERFTRSLSGQIYGPRMWETMKAWQDIRPGDGGDYGDLADVMYRYGETWRSIPTYVFNRQEHHPLTGEALRELKRASGGVLSIGGPGLAAVALREGEVDEVARYVVPHATGGGTPWWPVGLSADLELVEEQSIDAGWVYLRYRVVALYRRTRRDGGCEGGPGWES